MSCSARHIATAPSTLAITRLASSPAAAGARPSATNAEARCPCQRANTSAAATRGWLGTASTGPSPAPASPRHPPPPPPHHPPQRLCSLAARGGGAPRQQLLLAAGKVVIGGAQRCLGQ